MHELSIALELLDQALDEAEKHQGRLVGVRIRWGPLSGVDAASLRAAFELATASVANKRISLEIEEVSLIGECPSCGEQPVEAIHSLRCGRCQTPIVRVRQGHELDLVAIELESDA